MKSTVGGVVTNYHYDGNSINVLYETDGSGNLTNLYTYSSTGVLLSLTKDNQTYYYHYNGHGDVVQLTDQSDNIVASYIYDAWGNILSSSGSMASANPYRYAGYRYDSETGLYYLIARYYSPANGAFLSVDPEPGSADDPLNLNPYIYTRNNPVMYADPDGKWIVDAVFLASDVADFKAKPSLAAMGWIAADVACFADPSGAASTIAHAGKAAKVVKKGTLVFKGVRKAAKKVRAVCFTGDTLIYTENAHKLIKDIQVGDEVYSENPETGEKGLKKVVQVFVNESDTLIHLQVGSEEIKTTPSHPFWVVGKGWVEAGKLTTEDKLLLSSNQIVNIDAIDEELLNQPITVYNFEVENWHTYFVSPDGVLVHNMCAAPKGMGNPFKGKAPEEIDKMFRAKGFAVKGSNPVNGIGGYVNPKTNRSYHIDYNNSYNEAPHVDVNRSKSYKGPLKKKKYYL